MHLFKLRAEYKIQQYENKAALGEVIADFAHEVRNPLQSFVSGLQLMKKLAKPDDSTLGSIEQMLDDCSRINDLMEIRSLLFTSEGREFQRSQC